MPFQMVKGQRLKVPFWNARPVCLIWQIGTVAFWASGLRHCISIIGNPAADRSWACAAFARAASICILAALFSVRSIGAAAEVERSATPPVNVGGSDEEEIGAARHCYERHQWAWAKKEYDDVIAAHPRNKTAYFHRAQVLTQLLNIPDAIRDYEFGIREFPQFVGHCDLASLYARTGQFDKANEIYGKMIETGESDAGVNSRYHELGKRFDVAEKAIKDAVPEWRREDRPGILSMVATFYERRGRFEDALRQYDVAIALSDECRVNGNDFYLFRSALCQIALGNDDKALLLLDKAIDVKHGVLGADEYLPYLYRKILAEITNQPQLDPKRVPKGMGVVVDGFNQTLSSSADALALLFSGTIDDAAFSKFMKRVQTLLPYSEEALQMETLSTAWRALKVQKKSGNEVRELLRKGVRDLLQKSQPLQ